MDENPTMPGPNVSSENREYWDAAQRGVLVLKTCRSCGKAHHYPRSACPYCFSTNTEWREASGAGVIYSFTVMRRERPVTAPAYVMLDEGILMLSSIVGCDPDAIGIGMPVQVSFVAAENGVHVPVFRPA